MKTMRGERKRGEGERENGGEGRWAFPALVLAENPIDINKCSLTYTYKGEPVLHS